MKLNIPVTLLTLTYSYVKAKVIHNAFNNVIIYDRDSMYINESASFHRKGVVYMEAHYDIENVEVGDTFSLSLPSTGIIVAANNNTFRDDLVDPTASRLWQGYRPTLGNDWTHCTVDASLIECKVTRVDVVNKRHRGFRTFMSVLDFPTEFAGEVVPLTLGNIIIEIQLKPDVITGFDSYCSKVSDRGILHCNTFIPTIAINTTYLRSEMLLTTGVGALAYFEAKLIRPKLRVTRIDYDAEGEPVDRGQLAKDAYDIDFYSSGSFMLRIHPNDEFEIGSTYIIAHAEYKVTTTDERYIIRMATLSVSSMRSERGEVIDTIF